MTFQLPTGSGAASGLRVGTGRFIQAKGDPWADYVPDASKMSGSGVFHGTDDPGEYPLGVVNGSVSFGPGVLTLADNFTVPRAGSAAGIVSGEIDVGSGVNVSIISPN